MRRRAFFSDITRQRLQRFRSIRRAYIAFWVLAVAFGLSLFSEFLAGETPLLIYYRQSIYLPIFSFYPGTAFGQEQSSRADYHKLRSDPLFQSEALMISPPYPADPLFSYLDQPGTPPHLPSARHWLGTDRQGRDVLARLLYGFRTCMLFALALVLSTAILGTLIGGLQGYLGGLVDIGMQRMIEIWAALPFLYVVILVGSIYGRSIGLLIVTVSLFSWIGLSYYMRAEFLKLRTENYIRAARALGVSGRRIFFRHILPNALTPMVTILPFTLISGITALTALDFLGFGLNPPTPSWGELLQQGLGVIREFPHLTIFTTLALFITMMLATLIGEGIREAFDPHSRSRVE